MSFPTDGQQHQGTERGGEMKTMTYRYMLSNVPSRSHSCNRCSNIAVPASHYGHQTLTSGNDAGRINEITVSRFRLEPGWVTVLGWANHLGMQPAAQANLASYPTGDGK